MNQPSTPGKVIIYHVETGEAFERWPIDAREMLSTGDYTQEVPGGAKGGTGAPPAPPLDPVPHVKAAEEALKDHPHKVINREPEPPPAAIPPPEEPAAPAPADEELVWTLKTKPEQYLKRNPNGPNAELARKILGL